MAHLLRTRSSPSQFVRRVAVRLPSPNSMPSGLSSRHHSRARAARLFRAPVVDQLGMVRANHRLMLRIAAGVGERDQPRLDFRQGEEVVRFVDEQREGLGRRQAEQRVEDQQDAFAIRHLVELQRIVAAVAGELDQHRPRVRASFFHAQAAEAVDHRPQRGDDFHGLFGVFLHEVPIPRREVASVARQHGALTARVRGEPSRMQPADHQPFHEVHEPRQALVAPASRHAP